VTRHTLVLGGAFDEHTYKKTYGNAPGGGTWTTLAPRPSPVWGRPWTLVGALEDGAPG